MATDTAGGAAGADLAVNGDGQLAGESFQQEIERLFAADPVLRDWKLEFVCRHPARSSEVFEYRRQAQPEARHIIVKHRKHQMSREESSAFLAGEFRTLEAIWNRADSGFRETIQRPVTLLPEAGAAVFEAVRGRPMTQLLRQWANCVTGPFCRKRMCRIARQTGTWLRRFHAVTAGPLIKHDPAAYAAKLSCRLGKSQAAGLGEETATRVWEVASKANGNMRKEMTRVAQVHGDFIPQNILVSGNHVSVIDFEAHNEMEDIHQDLGFFVAYLRVLAGSRAYSGRALAVMRAAFLEGYGEDPGRCLLDLYVLKAVTMMFADQFSARGRNPVDSEKAQHLRAQLDLAARDLAAS